MACSSRKLFPKLLMFLVGFAIVPPVVVFFSDSNISTAQAFSAPCQTQQITSQMEQISGTVTYRQRIALPPDARLVVRLEDVSRADAPAILIAEKTIETAGQQVPISFVLDYDPTRIEARNRYAVRAQIFYGDELRWTSTTLYSVITQDKPTEVTIELQPIRRNR